MTTATTRRTIQISEPSVGEEEWQALREPLMSGWLTQGPKVAAFERAFAERHGVRHAVATTSCTTALHLGLAALGIGPGDEVLVPGFTWIATANVVEYCGATPVFVDIEADTYNIDPAAAAAKVTDRTRAAIAVHLFGLCADVDALRAALPGRVRILEDAACAVGAAYKGRPAGGLGTFGAFSFHPRKPVTTGEGGMLTTDDDDLAERMRELRNHGASVSEEDRHASTTPFVLPRFEQLGFNYRMTDMQGAMGLVQLGKLEAILEERRRWAEFYRAELEGVAWLRQPVQPEAGSTCSWQAYVASVRDGAPGSRDGILTALYERGISARPGTHAVPVLGYYRDKYGLGEETCPAAVDADRQTLALPLHGRMRGDDYRHVVQTLREL